MEDFAHKYVLGVNIISFSKVEPENQDHYQLNDPVVEMGYVFYEYHNELMYMQRLVPNKEKYFDLSKFMLEKEGEDLPYLKANI